MDKVSYYQKKIKDISALLEGSRQGLAMMQQQVDNQEADLVAYRSALAEEFHRLGIEPIPAESTIMVAVENVALKDLNNGLPQSHTDRVRALLRQTGPLTAGQIFSRMAEQGTSIARPYLYALLSRMVTSGEAKRANGLYTITERQIGSTNPSA